MISNFYASLALSSSEPTFIGFNIDNQRIFNRVLLQDSLFNFHPYAEISLNDKAGVLTNQFPFIEPLTFTITLGINPSVSNDTQKSLSHNFVYAENQLNNTQIAFRPGGDLNLFFTSAFTLDDNIISKSFKGTNKSIVSSILANYKFENISKNKGMPAPKFVSDNDNTNIWYQHVMKNSEFFRMLCKYSYSEKNKISPFVTFFNLKEEFYLAALEDLILRPFEKPIAEYSLTQTDLAFLNRNSINTYTSNFLGLPVNLQNYHSIFFNVDTSGSYKFTDKTIQSYAMLVLNEQSNKLPIRKSKIGTSYTDPESQKNTQYRNQLRSHYDFGIKESIDNNIYNGYINSHYIDSLLSNRLTIGVPFNPNAVSGKLVTLNFNDLKHFSGNWLIVESTHLYHKDNKNITYSYLTLAKPTLNIDSKFKLYNDLI